MGECTFGGENGHQIGKFHLGWKLDIQTFPTSYCDLNLDTGKCPESRWKGARRIGLRRAARYALSQKTCFLTKNFKIDKIFSKFLEIWAGVPQSSTMLSQRGFGQNPKTIKLLLSLLPFDRFLQFCLKTPNSCLAN